jgi:thiamine-monophosphate kinase
MTAAGGDDYELVFTAPASARAAVAVAAASAGTRVTRIGSTTQNHGIALHDAHGAAVVHTFSSFDHFKTP